MSRHPTNRDAMKQLARLGAFVAELAHNLAKALQTCRRQEPSCRKGPDKLSTPTPPRKPGVSPGMHRDLAHLRGRTTGHRSLRHNAVRLSDSLVGTSLTGQPQDDVPHQPLFCQLFGKRNWYPGCGVPVSGWPPIGTFHARRIVTSQNCSERPFAGRTPHARSQHRPLGPTCALWEPANWMNDPQQSRRGIFHDLATSNSPDTTKQQTLRPALLSSTGNSLASE